MKKLLVILMVLFVLVGCKQNTDDTGKEIKFGFSVAVVNECQYVVYVDDTHGSTSMVHAGNCNNPIHQSKWIFTIDSVTGEINLPYIQK